MTLLLQTWNPSPLHFLWPPFCTGRSRMSLGRGGGSSPTGSLIEQIKLVALAFLHPGATDQSSVLVPAVLAGACLSHFRKSKKCSRRSSQGTVCGIASVFFVAAIERREEKNSIASGNFKAWQRRGSPRLSIDMPMRSQRQTRSEIFWNELWNETSIAALAAPAKHPDRGWWSLGMKLRIATRSTNIRSEFWWIFRGMTSQTPSSGVNLLTD